MTDLYSQDEHAEAPPMEVPDVIQPERPRNLWGVIRAQWIKNTPTRAAEISGWSDDEIELRYLAGEFWLALDNLDPAQPMVLNSFNRWQKKAAAMGHDAIVWDIDAMRERKQERVESRRRFR